MFLQAIFQRQGEAAFEIRLARRITDAVNSGAEIVEGVTQDLRESCRLGDADRALGPVHCRIHIAPQHRELRAVAVRHRELRTRRHRLERRDCFGRVRDPLLLAGPETSSGATASGASPFLEPIARRSPDLERLPARLGRLADLIREITLVGQQLLQARAVFRRRGRPA